MSKPVAPPPRPVARPAAPVKKPVTQPPAPGRFKRLVLRVRRMKLRYRIPLLAGAGLVLVAGLYVAVRSIQYAADGTSPRDVLPAGADVYARVVDLEGLFQRWRDSALRNMLKDPVLRADAEAWLAAHDMPSLDHLEDRDFFSSDAGRKFKMASRDAAVALKRMPDKSSRFVAAVRVGYLEFLATPILSVFPGLAGGVRGGKGEIVVDAKPRAMHVAFSGAIAVVSDDADLLAAALDRSRPLDPLIAGAGVDDASPGLRLEMRFASPDMKNEVDAWLHRFPHGPAVHYLNVDGARGVVASLDLDGPRLVGDVRFAGGRVAGTGAEAADLLNFAPPNAVLVQPTRSTARDLWTWLSAALRQVDVNAFDEGDDALFSVPKLKDAVRLLTDGGFDTDVLPLLDGPMLMTLAMEDAPMNYSKAPGQPFLNEALVFRTTRARQAYDAMRGVLGRIARGAEDLKGKDAVVQERPYQNGHVGWLDIPEAKAAELSKIIQPCFGWVEGAFIVSLHERTLEKIIDAAGGSGPRFADSNLWRDLRGPLADGGLGDLLTAPKYSALVTSGPMIKSGNEIYLREDADYKEDTKAARGRLRDQVVREWRGQKRTYADAELDAEVKARMNQVIAKSADDMRKSLAFLDHVPVVALRAEATDAGYSVRWSITFR